MSFLVGILTVLMVANCLLLILLILVQLPKKDAGAGLAFGGGAAESLFGAGSGNVLTKITKWAAGIFFVLALVLGSMESRLHNSGSASEFEKQVQQKQMQTQTTAVPTASQPVLQQPAVATPTNSLLSLPVTPNTNVPAK